MSWISSTLLLSSGSSLSWQDRRTRDAHAFSFSVLMPGPGVDEKLGELCLSLLGLEEGARDELLVGQPPVIPAGRLEGPQLNF